MSTMFLVPNLVNSNSCFNAALLELANSRHAIYEHIRMSGEDRSARRMLPVNCHESSSSALEASYARNMAKYFGEVSICTPSQNMSVFGQEERLSDALLLVAHSQHSIYDKTRISGENRIARRMLPTDWCIERADRCSDATDASYAYAMANYFVTKNVSPL